MSLKSLTPFVSPFFFLDLVDVVRTTTATTTTTEGNRMLKVMPVEFLGLLVYNSKIDGVEMNREVNLKGL